jgi:hypothetical protein
MKRAARSLAAILPCWFAPLFAQDVSTPFRAGQWAAQFGWEGSLGSLGVIAFTGPTRAWLLDVQLDWRHAEVDMTDAFGAPSSGDDDFLNMIVRAGRRFYQARGAKVVTYQSAGLLGGAFRSDRASPGFTAEERRSVFGLFGDVGAAYAITPNLTIGFTGTLDAWYETSKRGSSFGSTSESTGFSVSAPSLRFVATIYF